MRTPSRRLAALFLPLLAGGTILVAPASVTATPPAASPSPVGVSQVASIASGLEHSCAVLKSGVAKCWGWNSVGQLGYGDTANRGDGPNEMGDNLPAINLGVGRKAKAVTAGYAHACALLDNGTVKCWGDNYAGRLGYGDTTKRGDGPNEMGDNLPTVSLGTKRKAKAISAGDAHTCALLDNGTVKCWGANNAGQLGYGDTNNRGDGPDEMGDNLPAVNLGTRRKAKAISAGAVHTCALLDNNTIKCWGKNDVGQLGLGDTNNRGDGPNEMGNNLPAVNVGTRRKARGVTAGYAHACALLDNKSVKCWGANDNGELGYGDTNKRGDGPDEMGDNLPTVQLGTGRKVRWIATGSQAFHTCALLDDNTLKCWGWNADGELGYGDTNNRGDAPNEMGNNLPTVQLGAGRTATLTAHGYYHTCALLNSGAMKCWGFNGSGGLGYGDTTSRGDTPESMGDNLPVVNLGVRVLAVATGATHACAILENSTVKCWGSNADGELGIGTTDDRGDGPDEMGDNLPTVDLGTGRTAKAIAAGSYHSCALLDNGSVKCWGASGNGQLGIGTADNRGDGPNEMGDNLPTVDLGTGRKAKAIGAGDSHTCALLDNGSVKCWGYNSAGELGIGVNDDRGDGPNEMGNNLPAVNLGTGRKAKAITVGLSFACALLDNNTVKCWGFAASGRLGYGDSTNRGDAPGEMGNNLPTVNLGTKRTAKRISAGRSSTCAILNNNTVKCWGSNVGGRLGLGDTLDRGDGPDEMGNNLPVVDLGTGRTARAVASGNGQACALLDNSSVKCWGINYSGELGYGDRLTRGDGPNEMGNNLPVVDLGTGRTAKALAAGAKFTCALLDNGTLKCWGYGSYGELGYGDSDNRGDGPNEMGDNLRQVVLTG